MNRHLCRVLAAGVCLIAAGNTLAERADREKPIRLEADMMSIDDLNKVRTLEGNVVLTQGTMQLRTNKLVITQDADGFEKAVATGGANGLARFRQKRDGSDELIEGEAERIEHDARTEKTEFFVRAWVRDGQDEVRGKYISYDALNAKYLATIGDGAKTGSGTQPLRVRAVIQPKSKAPPPSGERKSEPLLLKAAPTVSPGAD